jgi:hypothetical protein
VNDFSRPLLNVCTTIPKYTNGMCESKCEAILCSKHKVEDFEHKNLFTINETRHTLILDLEVFLASLQASIYIEGPLVGS